MQQSDPPIIDYASPPSQEENESLDAMMRWRMAFGCFILLLICLSVDENKSRRLELLMDIAVLACIGGAFVCAIFTLIYMWRAAATEVTVGYAASQVVLAVLLSPILFLGIFLVPALVKSDLLRWRRVEARGKELE
jgi:hypothetical protein